MRIIALGDIHGNLPALETCWAQAEKEGYDLILHTGNVVGFGPFPDECVDFLAERRVTGVRGNFDENIGSDGEECGVRDPSPDEIELARAAFEWTRRHIGLRHKRWLADLPFEIRPHLAAPSRVSTGNLGVAVFHASPVDLYSGIRADMPESSFAEYGEAAGADLLIFGNTLRPFHCVVDRRHFVNAGSVGRPRDRNPHTGYAVIETDGDLRVSFRRFAYDIERTLNALRERGAPAGLKQAIANGA